MCFIWLIVKWRPLLFHICFGRSFDHHEVNNYNNNNIIIIIIIIIINVQCASVLLVCTRLQTVEKQVILERLPIMTYWLRKEGCNNLYLKPEWPYKGTKAPSIRDPDTLQKEKKLTFVLVTGLRIMRLKHHADMRGVRYKSSGEVFCMISGEKREKNLFVSYRGYFSYKTFLSLPSYYAL